MGLPHEPEGWNDDNLSLRYHVLVELDLAADISPADLATVRWLAGIGRKPTDTPDGIEPLVDADGAALDVSLPGGVTVSLVQRPVPAPVASPRICWSLALRTRLQDDDMYESGLVTTDWLGRRADGDGWFALAREELALTPTWSFVSHGCWTYLLSDGQAGPLDPSAPQPPPDLSRRA